MIQPGICGREITESVHWRGWVDEIDHIFGRRDNPIRAEMDGIASKVGPLFIVNVVLGPDSSIYGVYAGDYRAAHRTGCRAALETYAVSVKRADIVIVDSHPCDLDLWQAAKAASPAEMVMKPGGSVILVTPCPEGISPNHPEIQKVGYMPMGEIMRRVESGSLKNRIVACHLIAFGRILEAGRLILVSPGFGGDEVRRMGFDFAHSAGEALAREALRLGKDASVSILSHGGKIFPLVEKPAEN